MGREVRMVTPDWEHPKKNDGRYLPLLDNYGQDLQEFGKYINDYGLDEAMDYFGGRIQARDYMLPYTGLSKRTHYMMYENVTEGTPISPAFETPEELAHWLANNEASAFGDRTATYEQWLRVCKGGYAPSMIVIENNIVSGVEGVNKNVEK